MGHPVEPTVSAPVATPVPAPPAPQGPTLTPEVAALVEAATREAQQRAEAAERVAADLQAKFSETATSLEGLTKDAAERKAAEDKAKADAEAAARAAEEEKLDVKTLLERREQEFNAKLEAFQQKAEEERQIMAMEVRFQQLAAYTQGKIADNKDEILPELYDYITGTTPEEVDASIELAKQKSQGIATAAKAARTGQRAAAPGVSVHTGPSAMGSASELPDEDGSEESILRQLANDNPNAMANYAKLRERMNIGRAGTGLFG